jgi:alkylation response protein AidB-like acyl-CoA dehydrogenase
MLDGFIAAHDSDLGDDAEAVAKLVTELAGLGVWTVGTDDSSGGGGADRLLTATVFERLGRRWPALGWASVQAHAAIDVLAGTNAFAGLVAQLHSGRAAVAVVEASASHAHFSRSGRTVTGSVDRIDAAAPHPHLLVLADQDTALLIDSSALTSTPLRRSGFSGGFTRAVVVDAGDDAVHELIGVDSGAARLRLRLGAAAVAAGIAGAAADAAAEYAASRRQFGDALTAIPTVRHSLLEQVVGATISLSAVTTAAQEPVQSFAVLREACDRAIEVAAAALQSFGGYGYLAEYPAERYLRDAVSLRAAADPQGMASSTADSLVGVATQQSVWEAIS